VLRRRGLYGPDEMRDAIEQIPPEQYLAASYYERWLLAIEALLGRRLPATGGAPGAAGHPGGD
jgi:nitrile hydratase